MDWKTLLFSFEGRVGRGKYWGLVLVSLVLFGGLWSWSFYSLLNSPDPTAGGGTARWHDVDKSAWWILINLVPAVGGLVALVFNGFVAGTAGPNRFGSVSA